MCIYIYTSLSIYNMQNCNQHENCDWNPQHIRSTMHMRIQGRFWCLLVISFFEVMYEGKNFMCLRDQSYLFALERLRNITTTVRVVTNWWMLKELQEAKTFKGFQKGSQVWATCAKGRSWSSASVSANAASLSPTTFVCCLITQKCLVTGSVMGSRLWKGLVDKKVWTWTLASHVVIPHTVMQCC